MRILVITFLMLTLLGCSEDKTKTLAIGKMRLSGSAESGQYARQLFKVDRLLAMELARKEGWQVMESDRIPELLNEMDGGENIAEQAKDAAHERKQAKALNRIGRLYDKLEYQHDWGSEAMDKLLDDMVTKYNDNTERSSGSWFSSGDKLPSADYLLVGEMDGFDVYHDDSAQMINGVARTVKTRGKRARTRISFRIVDVENRRWLYSHSRNVEVSIPDDRNAESQIDLALSVMVKEAVATIGQEEDLPVKVVGKSGTQAQDATSMNVQTVRVAFGGFSYSHPDLSTDLADIKGKAASQSAASGNSIEDSIIPLTKLIKMVPVTTEIETMMTHRLKKSSGLRVIEQNMTRVKKLLAQQTLTDLSKGRQPGLPLGTLKGVDYLVFGIMHDMKIALKRAVRIEGVGTIRSSRPESGKARLHVYLQDVNTGEHVLSEELNLNMAMGDYKTVDEAVPGFLEYIADQSMHKFLLSLRPLEVIWSDDSRVVLNHGQTSGLTVGQKLEVFTKGESMVDQYTGAVMQGVGGRKLATIKITGFSPAGWAEANILEGGGVSQGMSVKVLPAITATKNKVEEVLKPAW